MLVHTREPLGDSFNLLGLASGPGEPGFDPDALVVRHRSGTCSRLIHFRNLSKRENTLQVSGARTVTSSTIEEQPQSYAAVALSFLFSKQVLLSGISLT